MFEKFIALIAASATVVQAAKKLETTKAYSSFGTVAEGDAVQAPIGSISFTEISGYVGQNKDKNQTTYVSTWVFLTPEREYKLSIKDDDQLDCTGTNLVPLLGTSFVTNLDGMGGVTGVLPMMYKQEDLLDWHGRYVQLEDVLTGAQIACSQIEITSF